MTRAKNSPKTGLPKKWFLWINCFFIFLLLLTYITPYVSAQKWGWLTLLTLTYPFVMLANGLFALGWFFMGSWYSAFSILAIVGGLTTHMRYVKLFSIGGGKAACEESIRLMSYNMRGLSLVPVKEGGGIEGKIDSLYNALQELKEFPDILCLQEASRGDLIAKRFGMKNSIHAPKSSLWLLSRYPILKHGELKGAEISPSCMWADLKTPQGILRVYNMHLVSNRITNTTEELIQDMDLKNENTWHNIRFIISRYKQTTKLRAIEAQSLQDHINKSPYPSVIAGDGNDTPLSNTYHLLSAGLNDSFMERGSGMSTTYESTLPLLRIDYLLGTASVTFKDHYTHHLRYSDHYPVSTGICINSPAGS
ncbi:MAG: endonuclease/exonuclease/phosphatase family protein [Saprospiraceae bacterium]|nr:endonuclease/exonuclease/phosphatase family protein [Candidatus Opimibacter iunctus]